METKSAWKQQREVQLIDRKDLNMDNLLIKQFEGKEVHTFIWNGRPCWIANQIVGLFGYADPSTTIRQCIEAEDFEIGLEYEVLLKDDLRTFKNMANSLTKVKLVSEKTPNLIIFYEDGLYGFLQYTDKPIGVNFRKWLRREVLPEIGKTGAYISNKTREEPKELSEKPSIETLNETAKIVLPIFEEVGMKPQYKAIALKQIYRRGDILLPLEELKAEREIFDLTSIAKELNVNSNSGRPHGQAIAGIIAKIDLAEDEKELVTYENNGHTGTTTQYVKSVIDKVKAWIEENKYPRTILHNGKKYKVNYK